MRLSSEIEELVPITGIHCHVVPVAAVVHEVPPLVARDDLVEVVSVVVPLVLHIVLRLGALSCVGAFASEAFGDTSHPSQEARRSPSSPAMVRRS